MPMGIAGSPDIFQAKMSELMATLEYVRAYIDDILCQDFFKILVVSKTGADSKSVMMRRRSRSRRKRRRRRRSVMRRRMMVRG